MERFLGIMVVAEHAAADAPDHRAMAFEKHLERLLIAIGDELLQELTVRKTADSSQLEQGLQVSVNSEQGSAPAWLAFMVRAIAL